MTDEPKRKKTQKERDQEKFLEQYVIEKRIINTKRSRLKCTKS